MDNNGYSCGKGNCVSAVFTVLVALLIGAIGLILGSVFAMAIMAALPAIIVAAVIIAVLIVIYLILRYCACRNRRY